MTEISSAVARQVTGEVQPSSIRNAFGHVIFFRPTFFWGVDLMWAQNFKFARRQDTWTKWNKLRPPAASHPRNLSIRPSPKFDGGPWLHGISGFKYWPFCVSLVEFMGWSLLLWMDRQQNQVGQNIPWVAFKFDGCIRKHPTSGQKATRPKKQQQQQQKYIQENAQKLLNTKNCPEKEDYFDRVLGSFESPPGIYCGLMPVQSIWHTVSPSFTRLVASGVMQIPQIWVIYLWFSCPTLGTYITCFLHHLCHGMVIHFKRDVCVGWWSSVLVGIPTNLRVLDFQTVLSSRILSHIKNKLVGGFKPFEKY